MIVRISIFDTIINLYKPYIMDNCIKIVSKIQFLTFGDGVKINKELSLCDLALYLSCLGRIRTLTGGTRIRRATITPQGNYFLTAGLTTQTLCPVCECKFRTIFFITQILW